MKVTPPMNTPKKEALLWSISTWSPAAMKEPKEVTTAAKPTRAWKAATVYGRSVTATLVPRTEPTAPPPPIRTKA